MASTTRNPEPLESYRSGPDDHGHFGLFGGRFVAETLMPLILDLEAAYTAAQQMEGMDRMKHGGMTGSENTTVYTPRETERLALSSPQKVGVEKSVRRTSVVGQRILPPADLGP